MRLLVITLGLVAFGAAGQAGANQNKTFQELAECLSADTLLAPASQKGSTGYYQEVPGTNYIANYVITVTEDKDSNGKINGGQLVHLMRPTDFGFISSQIFHVHKNKDGITELDGIDLGCVKSTPEKKKAIEDCANNKFGYEKNECLLKNKTCPSIPAVIHIDDKGQVQFLTDPKDRTKIEEEIGSKEKNHSPDAPLSTPFAGDLSGATTTAVDHILSDLSNSVKGSPGTASMPNCNAFRRDLRSDPAYRDSDAYKKFGADLLEKAGKIPAAQTPPAGTAT
jgi:hypothetical protein